MSIAGGIVLLVVGAILTFALTGSIGGIDLHSVGIILMLAGAIWLIMPLPIRTRLVPRSRSTRPAPRSRQDVVDGGPQTALEPPRHDPSLNDDRRIPDGRRPWAGKGQG
jgi:Domain of unknown function (DUF6458)